MSFWNFGIFGSCVVAIVISLIFKHTYITLAPSPIRYSINRESSSSHQNEAPQREYSRPHHSGARWAYLDFEYNPL